ncbi:MAG: hypothetical protein JXD22_03920 [Sedimentisphaerales bacterium]|nr:hypothetical protein [Sedimentisphaerales bacterium]
MSNRKWIFLIWLFLPVVSVFGLVFEDDCQTISNWDFLDYKGDGKIYLTQDSNCPPGYGPKVLHVEGAVVLGLAKGAELTEGTFVILYKENQPRDEDGDGLIMFWAGYGQDVSAEHNTKVIRHHVWFEQDNDCGIQYRAIDDKGKESQLEERAGLGLVTDAWNRTNWIWQKVQIEGEVIRAKFWQAERAEPEGWLIETRYDLKGSRFGLRINSGDVNVAYFAADTADIKRPAPRAYLFFGQLTATRSDRIPLTLFINAEHAATESFEVVVSNEGKQLARRQFKVEVAGGHGEIAILLNSGEADADSEVINVGMIEELPTGLCKVVVSSDSGTYQAERLFQVATAVAELRRFEDAALEINRLEELLKGVGISDEKVAALEVIRDTARAHLERATKLFEEGKVEEADMSFRFVTEALSELGGYKGGWLNELAPRFEFDSLSGKFNDQRGIGQEADRYLDFYSTGYGLRFGEAELEAQSLVMGRSYEVVIPWVVEGGKPDREFDFLVQLVSPLRQRTVASGRGGFETLSSKWKVGKIYRQRVQLAVMAEDAQRRPAQPTVLDEYHYLLVTVTNPQTGARVLLVNHPGKQPDRVGESFLVDEVYVSSKPLEIRDFNPNGSSVGQERKDRALIVNSGDAALTCDALFTVKSETGRVVYQEVHPVAVSAGGKQALEFDWIANVAGKLTIGLCLMDKGVTLTEARDEVEIAVPAGYELSLEKGSKVEKQGDNFVTPLVIQIGNSAAVSLKVFAKDRLVGEASGKGSSIRVNSEPWFGYYDVLVDLGEFSYERRIIATVVGVEDGRLLVNGEPFIVKGVNVHGMDSSSPERTASMMRIMRELGFNAWRGDYPAPWQVDLAYEMNTCYSVLAPFSCTSTRKIFNRQVGPPMATARELTRLFVERYRDSAGVLLWNSANEISEENVDFLLSQYPVYKAYDPERRPVHYANLYGQDLWQGQDVMGVNYYFGENQSAVDRQPLIKRSAELAGLHGMPSMFCEYNSYYGAIHSTGVEAMKGLFTWGVEEAEMPGGFLYMKGNSTSHPGVFDAGFNTHKIFNEAIREAFADARVELAEVADDKVTLRIINRRRFTLRQMVLLLKASGRKLKPMQLEDLSPEEVVEVEVFLPKYVVGPAVVLDGELEFVTHFGFRCKVGVFLIANLGQ